MLPELPSAYCKAISTKFGPAGREWLDHSSVILAKYQERFQLSDLCLAADLSYNLVYYATSQKLGAIVIKYGLPGSEFQRELRALKLYDGQGACRLYYGNVSDRVMILERLLPGQPLREIKQRKERLMIWVETAQKLLRTGSGFPSYGAILDRAFKKAERTPAAYRDIAAYIQPAKQQYRRLRQLQADDWLLHGDLHHDNILASDKGYRAIDPQGLIGPRVLEAARFLENEISQADYRRADIRQAVSLTATYFKEKEVMISRALFIDLVLTACWDNEENITAREKKQNGEKLALLADYLGESAGHSNDV